VDTFYFSNDLRCKIVFEVFRRNIAFQHFTCDKRKQIGFFSKGLLLPKSPYGACVIHLTIIENFYDMQDIGCRSRFWRLIII